MIRFVNEQLQDSLAALNKGLADANTHLEKPTLTSHSQYEYNKEEIGAYKREYIGSGLTRPGGEGSRRCCE